MSGTPQGVVKAATTNKTRYGKDFYVRIGKMGGTVSRGGGFGSELKGKDGLTGRERARAAGKVGGKISKRGSRYRDDWGFLKVQDDEPILESVELQRSWKDRIWRHRI